MFNVKKLARMSMSGIVICAACLLATACGSDSGAGKSNIVSNTKSVDQVLDEQINSADNTEAADDTDKATGTGDSSIESAATDSTGNDSESQSGDTAAAMDTVNSKLEDAKEQADASGDGEVDVDLTKLSSTMVYSEVYNMVNTPDDYMGKRIRMKGITSIYHDDADNNDYYACVIQDATACCAQGIEFVLNDGNYPGANTEVTVVGTFSSYKIEDYEYYTLTNAVME